MSATSISPTGTFRLALSPELVPCDCWHCNALARRGEGRQLRAPIVVLFDRDAAPASPLPPGDRT